MTDKNKMSWKGVHIMSEIRFMLFHLNVRYTMVDIPVLQAYSDRYGVKK